MFLILSLRLINSLAANRVLLCKWFPLSNFEALFHCILVSNFAIMISYAILCIWPLHQSSWISSLFLRFWNIVIMSSDISLFSFTILGTWKPSSYGTLCTSLRVLSWCYFFDDFLLTSFPVLSLLNCYNQKLDFLNRLPKIFHFISSTSICLFSLFDLWEISSTVSSNHSTAFCFHFSDQNLQEFFTDIWICLLK